MVVYENAVHILLLRSYLSSLLNFLSITPIWRICCHTVMTAYKWWLHLFLSTSQTLDLVDLQQYIVLSGEVPTLTPHSRRINGACVSHCFENKFIFKLLSENPDMLQLSCFHSKSDIRTLPSVMHELDKRLKTR